MNKFASQVKEAEVRGAMAAFIDAGLVKVAGQAAFDELCGVVADNIGYDASLNDIAAVTEQVLSGDMQKTAQDEMAIKAALGDLLMQKTAGLISNTAYKREAGKLMKMAYLGRRPRSHQRRTVVDPNKIPEIPPEAVYARLGVDPRVQAQAPLRGALPSNFVANAGGIKGGAPLRSAKKSNEAVAALADAKQGILQKALAHVGKHKLGYGLGGAALLAGGGGYGAYKALSD